MFIKKIITSNIYIYVLVRRLLLRLTFLLPHEKDMWGLTKINGLASGQLLDIGANDGITAISFRKLLPKSQIRSFEPNEFHRSSLMDIKKRTENFEYEMSGVSDSDKSFDLYVPIYKGYSLSSYAGVVQSTIRNNLKLHMNLSKLDERLSFEKSSVTMINLNHREDLNPALIKIDVEGHEYGVVLGVMRLVERTKPVLFIEYNKSSFEDCRSELAKLGYEPYCYDIQDNKFHFFSPYNVLNVYFMTKDHIERSNLTIEPVMANKNIKATSNE